LRAHEFRKSFHQGVRLSQLPGHREGGVEADGDELQSSRITATDVNVQ